MKFRFIHQSPTLSYSEVVARRQKKLIFQPKLKSYLHLISNCNIHTINSDILDCTGCQNVCLIGKIYVLISINCLVTHIITLKKYCVNWRRVYSGRNL